MKLRIDYSSQAIDYIREHDLHEKVRDAIIKSARYLRGDFSEPAHVRKLSGKWEGFYRTRIGRLRIIFAPNWDVRIYLCQENWQSKGYISLISHTIRRDRA